MHAHTHSWLYEKERERQTDRKKREGDRERYLIYKAIQRQEEKSGVDSFGMAHKKPE